jgi:hypothetical protein
MIAPFDFIVTKMAAALTFHDKVWTHLLEEPLNLAPPVWLGHIILKTHVWTANLHTNQLRGHLYE